METRTFDQIAQEFQTSAEQAHLSSDWTANAIDLYRAPCTREEQLGARSSDVALLLP